MRVSGATHGGASPLFHRNTPGPSYAVRVMYDATRTTTELLNGLHESDNERAWQRFDERYRPLVIAFSRKLGLSEPDANDVAQETMIRFLSEYRAGKYQRGQGRLRSWLIGIAKYRIADIRSKGAVDRRVARGDSAFIDLSNDQTLTGVWEEQRQSLVLEEAVARLRTGTRASAKTVEAFELLVVRGLPPAAVAEKLDMQVQDVYVAKSRCARKLREIVEEIEQAYDDGEVED